MLYLSATLCSLFVPVCNRTATESAQLGRNSIFLLLTFDLRVLPFSKNMRNKIYSKSIILLYETVSLSYSLSFGHFHLLFFPPNHKKIQNASLCNYLICLPKIAAMLESILKSSRELSTNSKCLRNLPNPLKTCCKPNPH